MEVGEEGDYIYLSLHCHHQNDSCIKMGSGESHFSVSLIVGDKVTRQCPPTTTFLKRKESRSGFACFSVLDLQNGRLEVTVGDADICRFVHQTRESRQIGLLSLTDNYKNGGHFCGAVLGYVHSLQSAEERGVERGSARRSSLKGRERAIVSQTNIGTVSKATLEKLLRYGVERIWAFPSTYIPS